MARSLACHSPRWNPPSASKDELAGAVPTEASHTPTPTPVVSRAPIPAPATASATTLSSDTELFKQFMKAYLETQVPGQTEVDSKPCKQLPKARFLDFYMVIHI